LIAGNEDGGSDNGSEIELLDMPAAGVAEADVSESETSYKSTMQNVEVVEQEW
jgi:hypothetical protein